MDRCFFEVIIEDIIGRTIPVNQITWNKISSSWYMIPISQNIFQKKNHNFWRIRTFPHISKRTFSFKGDKVFSTINKPSNTLYIDFPYINPIPPTATPTYPPLVRKLTPIATPLEYYTTPPKQTNHNTMKGTNSSPRLYRRPFLLYYNLFY